MAFLEGFLIGLSMIMFVGPVFFTLLKSALQSGFKAGWAVACGIIVSDILCVVLCSFGAVPFFKNPSNQLWLALAGTVILLVLGIKYLWKPNVNLNTDVEIKTGSFSSHFSQGFLVNFINPFVFVVWIGLIGYGQGTFGETGLITFLVAVLIGIFVTDTLKAYFAHSIKPYIKPKYLKRVFQGFGILLIIFGARLLLFVYTSLFSQSSPEIIF